MVLTLCEQCLQSFERADDPMADGPNVCMNCEAGPEPVLSPAPPPRRPPLGMPVEPEVTGSWPVRLHADARQWCQGRSALVRVPLLVFFAYVLVQHLRDDQYSSIVGALNLGIHELGHFAFRPLGQFMTTAGGTIAQLLVPVAGMVMFLRQRDHFAVACSFAWLSTSLFAAATYCADARSMELTLVVPGMGAMAGNTEDFHDWHRMLTSLGLLRQDQTLALLMRSAAVGAMALALVGGAWLCWQMLRPRDPQGS